MRSITHQSNNSFSHSSSLILDPNASAWQAGNHIEEYRVFIYKLVLHTLHYLHANAERNICSLTFSDLILSCLQWPQSKTMMWRGFQKECEPYVSPKLWKIIEGYMARLAEHDWELNENNPKTNWRVRLYERLQRLVRGWRFFLGGSTPRIFFGCELKISNLSSSLEKACEDIDQVEIGWEKGYVEFLLMELVCG